MIPNHRFADAIIGAAVLAAMLASACSSPSAPSAAPNPTIEVLQAQVAALSTQIEQLPPSPTPAPRTSTAMPEPTEIPPTLTPEPTNEPEVEATPTPAPPPTVFPTRTLRTMTPADAAPCNLGQIKGNRNSRIYHVPSGGSYSQTKANVECFDGEAQAEAAGYRRARN